ncbi:hypothetical protein GPZ77_29580 [Streptomyces sp. QHH-9511]|uniref:hypothetical protein n=1 Tax=Streptomyces sp. QHH-9511 TaxID=2684468 RepID=UPI001315EBD8|nr:hypothetical protein [Streptomyces sp. QHH-9511]QGZ51966.1 hypothetical protein GPZ77_29580 [Streptomyces sp. QHH-9511]
MGRALLLVGFAVLVLGVLVLVGPGAVAGSEAAATVCVIPRGRPVAGRCSSGR